MFILSQKHKLITLWVYIKPLWLLIYLHLFTAATISIIRWNSKLRPRRSLQVPKTAAEGTSAHSIVLLRQFLSCMIKFYVFSKLRMSIQDTTKKIGEHPLMMNIMTSITYSFKEIQLRFWKLRHEKQTFSVASYTSDIQEIQNNFNQPWVTRWENISLRFKYLFLQHLAGCVDMNMSRNLRV